MGPWLQGSKKSKEILSTQEDPPTVTSECFLASEGGWHPPKYRKGRASPGWVQPPWGDTSTQFPLIIWGYGARAMTASAWSQGHPLLPCPFALVRAMGAGSPGAVLTERLLPALGTARAVRPGRSMGPRGWRRRALAAACLGSAFLLLLGALPRALRSGECPRGLCSGGAPLTSSYLLVTPPSHAR